MTTIDQAVQALVQARQSQRSTPAPALPDAVSAYAVQDGVAPEVLYDIRNRLQEALRTAISSVTLMLGDWYREGDDEPMLCFEVRLRQAPDTALQLLCAAPRRRL